MRLYYFELRAQGFVVIQNLMNITRVQDTLVLPKNEIPRFTLNLPRFRDLSQMLRDYQLFEGPFTTPYFALHHFDIMVCIKVFTNLNMIQQI